MSEEPESCGRRKRVDGLQLGPRKRPYAHVLYNVFNTNHFVGPSPIRWCITDAISVEQSMRYATFRRSLPMGFCGWVN